MPAYRVTWDIDIDAMISVDGLPDVVAVTDAAHSSGCSDQEQVTRLVNNAAVTDVAHSDGRSSHDNKEHNDD